MGKYIRLQVEAELQRLAEAARQTYKGPGQEVGCAEFGPNSGAAAYAGAGQGRRRNTSLVGSAGNLRQRIQHSGRGSLALSKPTTLKVFKGNL